MASVTLTNIEKVYPGGVRAVDGVSLDIAHGEFIVLVGPSGCGKSTTLRMVAGLEEITGGKLSIDGRVVNDVPARDRDIAMVFQNYALYPHMSVRKNLAFGIDRRRAHRSRLRAVISADYRAKRSGELREMNERVDEAARILGIEPLLDRLPRALSGGQRQRVAVGRAIVRDPKVFLFDEPLSNLDAKLRKEMRSELRSLHQRLAATMIYVTHDQEEAMTLGDRLVVMRDGIVQQAGPPLELFDRPANRFVAGFIGTPAMSFLRGEIKGSRFTMDSAAIDLPSPLPDGAVTIGLRPAAVRFDPAGTFRGEVAGIEHFGDATDVRVTCAGGEIVVRTGRDAPKIGESVSIAADRAAVHVFSDDEGGQRLN